jgi:hypothetical protein
VTVCEEHAVAVALSVNGEATEAPPAGLAIAVFVVLADGPELVVEGVSFVDPQPANEKTIATRRNFNNFIRIRSLAVFRKRGRRTRVTRSGQTNGRTIDQLAREA